MTAAAGNGLALLFAPAAMMLRAAAMLEPAHERAVAALHLHAIDAEIVIVLAGFGGALGDDERPGDERRGLAGPAGLHGKPRKIDVGAGENDLLAGRARDRLGPHGHDGFHERQHVQSLAQALGRLGLAQEGERLAHGAQRCRVPALDAAQRHRARHALDRAEEIDEHRHLRASCRRLFSACSNNTAGPRFGHEPGLDLGHLEHGGHGLC